MTDIIAIILPNQLFHKNFLPYDYKKISTFYVIEEPLYFCDEERKLNFNLLKLIYQRSCMKYYADCIDAEYINYNDVNQFWRKIKKQKVYVIDPVDNLMMIRLKGYLSNITFFENPAFICTKHDLHDYKKLYNGVFKQSIFYIWNRKRLDILMKDNSPIGGKYSYDKENRKKLNINPAFTIEKYKNKFYDEAIKYCEKTFVNHYPDNYDSRVIYNYPITHNDTLKHFKKFIVKKLKYFGDYEDAIDFRNPYLFHSVISPMINIGLITPHQCLELLLEYWYENTSRKLLPSVEGYIRQLFWREYSRMIYLFQNKKTNFFNHKNKLDYRWYNGTLGIEPVDKVIKEAFRYGYIHHILRLMVMCNWMNLLQINPNQAYNWFMEFSLDSYDWVMYFNVYSMGLFADGGVNTTKPYISTSNYWKKMSNMKISDKTKEMWNILYYYFIYCNYKKLDNRASVMKYQWDRYKDKKYIINEGKKIVKK